MTAHPDQFASVGIWSAGLFRDKPSGWEGRNEAFLKSAGPFNRLVKVLDLSVGDQDPLLAGSKSLAEAPEKRGITHDLHVDGGGHTRINLRQYLNAFVPRLFR